MLDAWAKQHKKVMDKNLVASLLQMFYERKILEKIGKEGCLREETHLFSSIEPSPLKGRRRKLSFVALKKRRMTTKDGRQITGESG